MVQQSWTNPNLSGQGPSILLAQDRSVAQKPHWGFRCFANANFFLRNRWSRCPQTGHGLGAILYEGALKTLLTAPDHPTAMLVSDDILAVVLEQFCGKLGLRVPKDLSIVSFNNSLFSRITSPQLTTVDVNPYQLGMEAASQTINHIENPNLLATKIIVPHKLIPRESCCPPPEVYSNSTF